MIWLVTGPDNSGKDSVIKALQNQLKKPAHVLHYSSISGESKKDVLDKSKKMYTESIEIARFINDYLKTNVIFNRFWEGEKIYGPMYRSYTEQEADYVFDLETIPKSQVRGIYVTANVDVLMERDDGLSQSDNDKFKIIKELKLFEEFISKSKYDFSTINTSFTTTDSLNDILKLTVG